VADLKTEIYLAIKDFCKNNDSAEWAACTATKLVEEKFTSTNKQSAPCCEHEWTVNRLRTCKKCGAVDFVV
jgi:hypothetical protein